MSRRLVAELRERATAMCDGVENVRGVVWLEPTATVDVQYNEPMQAGRVMPPLPVHRRPTETPMNDESLNRTDDHPAWLSAPRRQR